MPDSFQDTCSLSLPAVAGSYGVSTYAVYLFFLSIYQSYAWGDVYACPYLHVEDWWLGRRPLHTAALRILAEVTGGWVTWRSVPAKPIADSACILNQFNTRTGGGGNAHPSGFSRIARKRRRAAPPFFSTCSQLNLTHCVKISAPGHQRSGHQVRSKSKMGF